MKILKFFAVFLLLFVLFSAGVVWFFFRGGGVDFYGKVVDQYGSPVRGMKVEYDVHGIDFVSTGVDGVFHIESNEKPRLLSIRSIKKEKYEVKSWISFQSFKDPEFDSWENYDKNNPYVFHAWKVNKYAKVLVNERDSWYFDQNQTYSLDLQDEEHNVNLLGSHPGDIKVLFSVTAGDNWTANISAVDGGLQESFDQYMNMAPETGYMPTIEYTGKTKNDILKKTFYLKSRNGKYFSALKMEIHPIFNREHKNSAIFMSYVVNLEGGRELAVRPEKDAP